MNLSSLKPRPNSRHRVKRLGCGESSGHGKTSGKGHKGQKARSGGSIRLGFEGGQMPLYRRMPKRGFSNEAFRETYATVNVGLLNDTFESGATIDEKSLRQAGLIRKPYDKVKILGNGTLTKKFTIVADKATKGAIALIEKAGGQLTIK
jgi:large subunit ribosomal protein L15